MSDEKPVEYEAKLLKITNNSKNQGDQIGGPRVFHSVPLIKGSPPDRVTINPGETKVVNLITPDHPVYKDWLEKGTITFDEVKDGDVPEPPPPGKTPMIEPQSAKPTKS